MARAPRSAAAAPDPLAGFTPAVRDWFTRSFAAPTDAQTLGWPAIASGEHTLILAPTGSGKTLAAFLWALDRIAADPLPAAEARTRLLYISPLRALAVDIEKNLRAPLAGIRLAAERLGQPAARAHGRRCAPATRRPRTAASCSRHPPDILITTPESLYLMLTSSARDVARRRALGDHRRDPRHGGDEAGRAPRRCRSSASTRSPSGPPQRIGLSATQRPLEEIARFLGGQSARTGPAR